MRSNDPIRRDRNGPLDAGETGQAAITGRAQGLTMPERADTQPSVLHGPTEPAQLEEATTSLAKTVGVAQGALRLTEAIKADILQDLEQGVSIKAAFESRGIPERTAFGWLQIGRGQHWPDGATPSEDLQTFARALTVDIARAQAKWEAHCQKRVFQAANSTVGAVDWRAADAMLAKADATRARWREHRELKVEHAGQVSLEHRLAVKMDRDQLTDCIDDPEWRELLEPGQSG